MGKQYLPPSENGYLPPCNSGPDCSSNFTNNNELYPTTNLLPRPFTPPYNNNYPPNQFFPGQPTTNNYPQYYPSYFPHFHGHTPPIYPCYPGGNGYLPPSHGHLPPNNGYLPPNNGYLPPNNGYPPPNNGYPPPNNGYPPPNNGYLPPNNEYLPPNNGYLPPNNGYLPPNNGYPPTNTIPYQPPIGVNPPLNFPFPPIGSNPPEGYPLIPPTIPPIVEITPVRINSQRPPIQVETQSQIYPTAIPRCCRNTFNARRLYLTNSGFPNQNPPNNDCLYVIERNNPGICRLRIEFRYFVVGRNDPQLGCVNSFVEIDGKRICGCNTGVRYISQWGFGPKLIRYRMNPNIGPGVHGMLLDVIQEDCPNRLAKNGNGINGTEWDRADQSPIVHNVLTQTNSTSLSTYYYYPNNELDANPQSESKDELDGEAETPSSRFFFPRGNNWNRCVFNLADWIRLAADPLWIFKPICYI